MSKYNPEKSRAYYRSVPGLIRRIYHNQKMTSGKMGRNPPSYSYEDLYKWVTSHPDFQTLYDNWVKSDYQKELVPSIDRVSNYLSYSLNNIQLVAFKDNLKNQKDQNKSEEYLHTGSKAVIQLSLDGVYIQEFGSVGNAIRSLGKARKSATNIAKVCDGKNKTAYGYKWAWKDALS